MKIYSDKILSQKLERTEARTSVDLVESRKVLFPEIGAEWIEVAGTYAIFDGVESPLTQTFGLGVFDEITNEHLDEIEAFFKRHNAPVFHEVSPMADALLIGLLNERGYRPVELTSVMFRLFESKDEISLPKNPNISTKIIGADEIDIFAKTAVAGWSAEMPEFESFGLDFCKVSAHSKSASSFMAEIEGVPIATATLFICEEVGELVGASTMPEVRNQGAQNALLAACLNCARTRGCKIAMMGALPGSQSQRNAEKNGFRIAYTRTKWHLKK
ncbi:MAG: GNAT family N-acetyltransferase [Acidobacteriota bacterium]